MNMRLAKRLFGGAIGAMAIMIVVIFINKLRSSSFNKTVLYRENFELININRKSDVGLH